jgi:hypothetical protein
MLESVRGGRSLFDEGCILLRHLIHLAHGFADLLDARLSHESGRRRESTRFDVSAIEGSLRASDRRIASGEIVALLQRRVSASKGCPGTSAVFIAVVGEYLLSGNLLKPLRVSRSSGQARRHQPRRQT